MLCLWKQSINVFLETIGERASTNSGTHEKNEELVRTELALILVGLERHTQ